MIIYTPIDLPNLTVSNWDKFWSVWNEHNVPLVKRDIGEQKSDILYTRNIHNHFVVWRGIDIYHSAYYEQYPLLWNAPLIDTLPLLPEFAEFIDIINQQYPMHCIRLSQSQLSIPSHTDNNDDVWEVRGFLYHPNEQSQWYFTKPRNPAGKRLYANLPPETKWFAYHDRNSWHGTDFTKEKKKILIQFFPLPSGRENLKKCISDGMKKYSNYTLAL